MWGAGIVKRRNKKGKKAHTTEGMGSGYSAEHLVGWEARTTQFPWCDMLKLKARLAQAGNAFTAEDAQQVISQRQEEAGGARVALTTGTTPELVVHPAGLMPFGTNHM